VAFDPEGDFLISAARDGTIRFWHPKTLKLQLRLYCSPRGDWLAVTPEGRFDGTDAPTEKLSFSSDEEKNNAMRKRYRTEGLMRSVLQRLSGKP
jgi:WD40 repeat protein